MCGDCFVVGEMIVVVLLVYEVIEWVIGFIWCSVDC